MWHPTYGNFPQTCKTNNIWTNTRPINKFPLELLHPLPSPRSPSLFPHLTHTQCSAVQCSFDRRTWEQQPHVFVTLGQHWRRRRRRTIITWRIMKTGVLNRLCHISSFKIGFPFIHPSIYPSTGARRQFTPLGSAECVSLTSSSSSSPSDNDDYHDGSNRQKTLNKHCWRKHKKQMF
jgi:UDP:flavonoid glycosyltransferase YjiC (YdhE family)